MGNPILTVDVEHALGVIGLMLMLIVIVMARHGYTAHQTITGRFGGFLARRTIDAVALIGWLVDHLPRPIATVGGM